MLNQINEAVRFIQSHGITQPEVGVILGTGLGNRFVKEMKNTVVINYNSIPHFPISTVESHKGKLIYGELKGKRVLAMQGRFHYYEGYDMQQITLPVRVMKFLGIDYLLISNAAGTMNLKWKKGELMLIDDHINLQGVNPLAGPNDERFGLRFHDMTAAYDKRFREMTVGEANRIGIGMYEGVYAALLGPSYETPAEIRYLRAIGADLVGMSTVPEVTAARHSDIRVLGISCVTNAAAGILDQPLNHLEVLETAERVKGQFIGLLKAIIPRIAEAIA